MRILVLAGAAVLAGVVGLAAANAGADQTWTGKISDDACNATHESGAENVPTPPDPECVAACVRGGSMYVLLVGDQVFKIANQDNPGLVTYAGKAVKVTGALNGQTITVSSIAAP